MIIKNNPEVDSLVEHMYSKYHSDIKNSPVIQHTIQSHVFVFVIRAQGIIANMHSIA